MNAVSSVEARPFKFGGAVRLLWVTPSDADYDHVVILRKTSASFTGIDDPAATVVYRGMGRQAVEYRSVFLPGDIAESDRYRTILDVAAIGWNTAVYYAVYAVNHAETDVSVAVLAAASLPPISMAEEPDIIGLLLPFISSYLKEQIAQGALLLPPTMTEIQVVDGPPLIDSIKFPVVSLHLDDDRPMGYAIGDQVGELDETGDDVVARRGFLSGITIAVVGVTDNPEIRRQLYRAIKACLTAARQLLEQQGVANMDIVGRFGEDFTTYDMPLYSAELTLKGSVASTVAVPRQENIIQSIDVTMTAIAP